MRYTVFSRGAGPLLHINDIGYARDTSVTCFGPGRRDVYLIHYVISGRGVFNENPVGAGQGFIITPGMLEEYHADEDEPWEFVWIISDDKRLDELLPYCNADPVTNIFDYDFVSVIRASADMLVTNRNARLHPVEMLDIFLGIFKNHVSGSALREKRSNADVYIDAAVDYVDNNIFRQISVTELSGFLGVSQPYLYKIFREKLGRSPKQYITLRKLMRAQELLRETELTVTQIAASVGFGDVLCFSKFFAHQTALSPQNYRLKHRQK